MLFTRQPDFLRNKIRTMSIDNGAKTMVFSRGDFIIAINLHWTQSYADWPILVPPGSYELRLSTDSQKFGGQGRIAEEQTFHSMPETVGKEEINNIFVYLPARTALVLSRKRGRG